MPPEEFELNLDPQGRWRVQRDMELIREICRSIIGRDDLTARAPDIEGYEPWVVQHHVDMLYQAGYINGARSQSLAAKAPTILVRDLTWDGHEFAVALLNDTVWTKVKTQVAPEILMKTPLKIIAAAINEVAGALLKQQLGIS